ncbi:MAG: helix-turn-helix domain-containing protein [Endomicrobium sp.]|jgi:transcriptional regulator with XRE-family HTH domain|nr:helix-turn-helix domain-containing protein [Endomicrobium sp.]
MIKNHLGIKLKQAMLDAGLTQKELSIRTGVRQQYISDCIYGRRNPKAEILDRFAEATKKPLSYFLSAYKEEPKSSFSVSEDVAIYRRQNKSIETLKREIELLRKESENLNLKIRLILEKLKNQKD